MKKSLILLVLSVLAPLIALCQTKVASTANQQCELPNGTKMILDYSTLAKDRRTPQGAQMDFYTSANVVSVRGTTIPSGIYKVKAVYDSNQWTLVMKQVAGDGITPPKPHSDLFELPMSVKAALSQSATPVISLEPIAQTCTLHMKWQLSQASVEFAGKWKDLPTK
jgi:hypothetical protein